MKRVEKEQNGYRLFIQAILTSSGLSIISAVVGNNASPQPLARANSGFSLVAISDTRIPDLMVGGEGSFP
uniref:Putative ovule protein n=1 Tax=Solanum chacoense TaxID=4108 RepID=A0A0V0GWI2_SOLCH